MMSVNDWTWLVTALLVGTAGYFLGVSVTTHQTEKMMYLLQQEIQLYTKMLSKREEE